MKRQCGTCTLCCKLVPVKELRKKANVRCQHQSHAKGCAIYSRRPLSCAYWSCVWLMGGDHTRDLPRPDRVHYVIDKMPDFVRITDNVTGSEKKQPVLQVWLDPDYPDAHHDPALRAFLEAMCIEKGMLALVRFAGTDRAIMLVPPSANTSGEWVEVESNMSREPEHSAADIHQAMEESFRAKT